MKRYIAIFVALALVLVLVLFGCTRTRVNTSADVTLTFIYQEKNICVTLEEDEAKKVAVILNGNRYDPFYLIPSCGFDENISLKVGGRTFAIACDTCNYVQDLGNLRFFDISKKDMEYIHSLFEKYGGRFPCV